METQNIQKLIKSLHKLYRAVCKAEGDLLSSCGAKSATLSHIRSYKSICEQQLELAHTAEYALNHQQWQEAERCVCLINSLADFVKEDATDLVDSTNQTYPHMKYVS